MATIDEVIEGLQIIKKYASEEDSASVEAQHDILYCNPDLAVENMLEVDKQRMDELGWHIDDELNCWACFT